MAEKNGRLTGTLLLEGISLTLVLGALPFEKIETRRVLVDISWKGDLFLENKPVVDYSSVCVSLGKKLKPAYDYVEELASDILEILKDGWGAGKWSVTVKKLSPPTVLHMERATVTVEG